MEGAELARTPDFVVVTILSAAMCVWSWRVWRRLPR
jgi:hypothetical protein